MSTELSSSGPFITPEALLQHWQGHRRLTRRVIEAFPEDQLFSFSVRPFGALALEMISMTAFGQYEGRVYDLLLYVIDNEIHHRGQGYVYLRALGIEPPPFYERH